MSDSLRIMQQLGRLWRSWFGQLENIQQSYPLDACVLEDRVLYSATVMPVEWSDLQPDVDASLDQLNDLVASQLDAAEILQLAATDQSVAELGNSSEIVSSQLLDGSQLNSSHLDSLPTEASAIDPAIAIGNTSADDHDLTAINLLQQSTPDATHEPTSIESAQDTLWQIDQLLNQFDDQLIARQLSSLDSSLGLQQDNAWLENQTQVEQNEVTSAGTQPVGGSRELAFVQAGLYESDALIADLQQNALATGRNLVIVVLNGIENGFDQINQALSQYNDLDAIHIVSHGAEGMIQLGGSWLTAGNIQQHAVDLQRWGMALSEDGDILIYGCDVAAGVEGQAFIDAVAQLTSADVAASINQTGDYTRGGDWNLEYAAVGSSLAITSDRATGLANLAIQTPVAFGRQLQATYGGLLATVTVSTATDNNDAGIVQGNASHTITWLLANRGTDGQISLREAIIAANNTTGADTITFAISGTGVHTINVTSSLTITDAVNIDATTDDSFAANSNRPAIILDGNNSFTGDGFVLTSSADGTTIRGFVIRDFTGDAIEIQAGSDGNTIAGNYIGRLTATGTDAGSAETNTGHGINILGANNIIGGTTAADRNIISGNTGDGVYITGASATGNVVAGNYIGLLADGTTALANLEGVQIFQASSNTIGGATTAHRNIISGNTNDGVQIWSNANNNIVQNNYIGTDVTGTLARGNNDDGIDIDTNSSGTQILNNLISGNTGDGIDLADGNANSTTIQSNLIGTQANGTSSLGNTGHGILIGGTINTISIGGTTAGQGNTIAFNGGDGVYVSGGTGISILGNSIFSNTGLGIDLGTNGVTNNDNGDGDSGANNLQNYAVVDAAVILSPAQMRVDGSLNSTANTNYRIEFFASPSADATGFGEGTTYLGFINVLTNGSGNATFNTVLTGSFSPGNFISTTTTRLTGGISPIETSEFSASVFVGTEKSLWISGANNSVSSAGSGGLAYDDSTIVRLSDPNLTFGSGTANGYFTAVFDIDDFAADGSAQLHGLHWVASSSVTVGTTNAITLQRGDILFSTSSDETFGGTQYRKEDIILFRPTTVGDYSSGTFSLVLRNPGGTGNSVKEFALVETAMTVGGTSLQAGDFLLVMSSATYDKDVSLFRPTNMSSNPTGGTLSLLIDGSSAGIGFGAKITGLELVQADMAIGGQSLATGQMLISLDANDTVGTNNFSTTKYDIFTLTVSATGLSTSSGTATMFLRGTDIGLSAGGEEYDAIALVDAYNSAPVLDSSKSPVLSAVNEDAGVPTGAVGTLISALIDYASPTGQIDNVTDSNADDLLGIAITAANTSDGSWWYTTNGGTNWFSLGAVSSSSSRLLAADSNTRIYFQANADFSGTVNSALTFRAWDRTTGTNGSTANTSNNGGFSAFSAATDTADIMVNPVNDAPVLDNSGNMTLTTITEDQTTNGGQTVASIIASAGGDRITDVDSGAVEGIAIIATSNGNGTWQYSTNGGSTWINVGSVSGTSALLLRSSDLVRFVPDAQNGTTADFTFRAWDQTSGTTGTKVDVSSNGGITAFSSATEIASITVTSVNDAPSMPGVSLGSVNEDSTATWTVTSFTASSGDVDTGALKGLAIVGVDNTNGTWQYTLNGSTWFNVGSVSASNALLLAADATSAFRFVPNADWNGTTGLFQYKAWDQTSGSAGTYADASLSGGTTAFSGTSGSVLQVNAVNDAPVIAVPASQSIAEDGSLVLSSGNGNLISFTDVDAASGAMLLTLSATNGTLTLSTTTGLTLISGGNGTGAMQYSGTLANLNAALDGMTFTPEANFNGGAGIGITVGDQGNTGSGGSLNDSKSLAITVTAVNDAPVLDNSGNMTLTTVTEDQISNAGQTIASIISSAGGDRITDVDSGAVEGIAIIATTNGNGSWEYSTNGGGSWTSVGSVSGTSALLLRSTDLLRFVPNGQNSTSGDITFRAWDQTSGTAGSKVDASTGGGTTAFSSATEVASITVTAVNDAPTITNASVVSLTGTDEDTTSPATSAATILGSASWADVDAAALQGIAITGMTGMGTWQYSTNGSTWTSFGAVSSNSALLISDTTQVRYIPNSLNGETATFTFRAWDQTTGTASSNGSPTYGDASSNGGTTAYSSQTATAQIVVTSVNDAAFAVADTDTADEAGGYNNGTAGANPSGNVLANDYDVDTGDSFSVTGVAAGVVSSASGNVASAVSGTYGSISIAANGAYTYTVDNNNSVVQALRTSGQTLTDTFTYTIQDTGGAYSSTQIVITIRGANDAPVAAVDSATAIEAGGYNNGTSGTNPTGNVLTNDIDVDNGDTKILTGVAAGVQSSASGSVGTSVSGSYGSIIINSAGTYSYTVDNSNASVQALRNSGTTLTDVFTYTMQDAAGLSSTTQITITIQGANDAPTASDDSNTAVEAGGDSNGTPGTNPTGNVLTNDSDIDSGDTKAVSGVVAGTAASASGNVGISVSGSYGAIQIASDGSYTYTVDNNNAAVQALRTSAHTLLDLFTYTMTDAGGLTSTATVTITIQGANDAPVAAANSATAQEAGGVLNNIAGTDPTGNVLTNDTDVDSGDTKTVIGVAAGNQASASGSVGAGVVGSYGTLVINANGSFTYTVDNNNATVEALTSSQWLVETFTYTMQDTAGATATSIITITINGADDLPQANQDMATAVEAGGLNNAAAGTNPSGNVLSNDVNPNSLTVVGVAVGAQSSTSGSVGSTLTGLYGSIVVNADGSFSYEVDNNNASVQALRVSGNQLTEIYSYTIRDIHNFESTTQISITINGANDAPIAVNDSGVAVEAGGAANGTAGSNATGNVLSNDSDVDAAANGESKSVIGIVAGTAASASGSVGSSISGNYGSIVLNTDGSYSYTVDNSNAAVQALRISSQTLIDVFTYTMEDTAGASSTATVTITIQGANDSPLAVTDFVSAVEAGGINNASTGSNPSGNVLTNDTDADSMANGETKTVSGVAAGTQSSAAGNVGSNVTGSFGSITIASDGSYTYTVDNSNASVQALRTSGHTLIDIFTYTVTDAGGLSSTTQVTVTIQGANDNPVVSSDSATAVEAGGVANATAGSNPTGNVLSNDNDVDAGDTLAVSGVAAGVQSSASGSVGASVAGLYGSLNIASDGTYIYFVDNNNLLVQALRTSTDTIQDVFTYTAQDAAGATATTQITITIQGRNDAPVAFADNNDAYEAGGTNNGTLGSGASGNVITNDLEYDAGDTTTVTGVAAGVQVATSGNVASSVSGNYGWLTLNADGAYSYVIDESNSTVQALRLTTQTINDIFSYTITDAAGLTSTTQITITIHGANDAPMGHADAGTAVEAGGLSNGTAGSNATGNVLSNDTDVDAGDTMAVSGVAAGVQSSTSGSVGTSVAGNYGSITIGSTGTYTYVVDNSHAAVQALRNSGQTLQDVFSYTVVDNEGLTSTTQVTITIQGANDAPVGVNDTATAVEASGIANGTSGTNPTGNVLTNDTDVDAGDTKAVAAVVAGAQVAASGGVAANVSGSYGSINIAADGSYTYSVDNSNAAVQALRTSGQTLQDLFTYQVVDAGGLSSLATITVTIQGANDAPVGVNDTATAVEAGGTANGTAGINPTGNVLTNDTDVDAVLNGETKAVIGVASGTVSTATGSVGSNISGLYGTLVIQADGSYVYTVDNNSAAVQALRTAGDTLSDIFSYTMADADGASSTAQLTVIIQGVNDAPHDITSGAMVINENLANGSHVGWVAGHDVDSGETLTYSLVANPLGRFAIDAMTGQITIANSTLLDYENATSHSVTVRVTDASGTFVDRAFTIDLNDVDEFNATLPIDLDSASNSVNENASGGTLVGIQAWSEDQDATNNAIYYSLTSSAGGRFVIDPVTGIVRVANGAVLNYEAASSHVITVRATSADGSVADRQFTVSVNNVNEAPVVTTPALSTNSITPIQLTAPGLLAFASDPENDVLTLQLITGPSSGVLSVQPDGTLVYTPSVQFNGTTSFVVQFSDGQFNVQATFSITVSEALVPPPPPPPPPAPPTSTTDGQNTSGKGEPKGIEDLRPQVGLDQVSSESSPSGETTENEQSGVGVNEKSEGASSGSNVNSTSMTAASVSSLAEALNLMTANRLMVSNQFQVSQVQSSGPRELRMSAELDPLDSMQQMDQGQREFVMQYFQTSVDSVVVTAVSTGIAIWAMYLGQVIVTLLSTSAAWVQIDPLTILQGDNSDDEDTELSAEERLFDNTKRTPS